MSTWLPRSKDRDPSETPADSRRFALNAERWTEFQAALESPPRPLPRLRRLLEEPSVFERREKA